MRAKRASCTTFSSRLLDDRATKINGQGRVRLEPKQPVKRVPVWPKSPCIAELAGVGLGSHILHNDQPEPVALSSSEGLLSLLPFNFVLDVRHRDRRDPASGTALPQTTNCPPGKVNGGFVADRAAMAATGPVLERHTFVHCLITSMAGRRMFMCGLTTSIWFRIALPCLCILCLRGTVASTAFIMGTVVCKAIVTVESVKD